MYKRKETVENTWLFPLFAAICANIAILVPTAHFGSGGTTWDWWMWDFISLGVIGYPSVTAFVSEMDFLILSIITTSVMILNVVMLIVLSVSTRKKKLNANNFVSRAVISAVLLMGIMIYYAIAMGSAFRDGLTIEGVPFPPGLPFWLAFTPSFGIILPFISAILLFIGVGLVRRNSNQKSYSVAPKTDVATRYIPHNTDVATKYIPGSTPMEARNYCPECGHKNLRADVNFCTNCGFKL